VTDLIIALFLGLFLLQWSLETSLAGLNLAHVLASPAMAPGALAGRVEEQSVVRSREYTVAGLRYALVREGAASAVVLAVLFSGLLPWLERSLVGVGLGGSHLFVVFLGTLGVASSLARLPFGLYRTFRIEARFGFNRMTFRLWLWDRLKAALLSALLGIPLLYGVYGFMEGTGRWWWLWLFAFLVAVQVVMVWLVPALIAPLFNKYTPLPDGSLRRRVEAIAEKAGFRTRGIFLVDASRRSGHSNAYLAGFGRPRIVLFDTLLERMSEAEIAAVLAHEIGHYRRRHIHRSLALSTAGLLLLLYILSWLVDWPPLFSAFGFAAPSTHVAVALLMLAGGAFTFWLGPVMAWLSRRREYEADAYSVNLVALPEALKSALIGLSDHNLSNLWPHPWYSGYHYSHPPLTQRLEAIDRLGSGAPPPMAPEAL